MARDEFQRMSARMPTGKTAPEQWQDGDLHINQQAMEQDPAFFGSTIDRIRRMPNLTADEKAGDDRSVAAALKEHMRRNLLYIYHALPEEQRKHSRHWYPGGNRIIRERAAEHGIPLQSAVGTYAAMSPQKNWYANASLGDRLLDIVFKRGDEKITPAMIKQLETRFGPKPLKGDDKTQARTAARNAARAAMIERLATDPRALKSRLHDLSDKLGKAHDFDSQKKFQQDIEDVGAFVRMFDEVNHDPHFAVLNPYGDYLDFMQTDPDKKTGKTRNANLGWGSNLEIGRGVASAISGGNPQIIRPLLGLDHKVPSFANNLGDPWHEAGDVTADTHAIAAALMRVLGAKHQDVTAGFSGPPNSKVHGLSGYYGILADAYRNVAKELGLSPRELQSITWEGAQGLFPQKWKTDEHHQHVEGLWRDRGDRPQRHIQDQIHEYAAGIAPPAWWGMQQRPGMHYRHYVK